MTDGIRIAGVRVEAPIYDCAVFEDGVCWMLAAWYGTLWSRQIRYFTSVPSSLAAIDAAIAEFEADFGHVPNRIYVDDAVREMIVAEVKERRRARRRA